MEHSDFSRSGYYPSDSTMDDNAGDTGNDTSALTSLDEDPYGGSESLENADYSNTGDGHETFQATSQYDPAQHDFEMSFINQVFPQEDSSSMPESLHAGQLNQSQESMSVYDVQPEAEPSDVSQYDAGWPPSQYSDFHHAPHSQLSYQSYPHQPVFPTYGASYHDHFQPQYAVPSAQEGLGSTGPGLGEDNATRNVPHVSHQDDFGGESGKHYGVHLHQGRYNMVFTPHQSIVRGRDDPWSTELEPNHHQRDLEQQVESIVGVIDTSEVSYTNDPADRVHGFDMSIAAPSSYPGITESEEISEGTIPLVETFQSNSIASLQNSGFGSHYKGLEGLAVPWPQTGGQQRAPPIRHRSGDRYDITPVARDNYLETPAHGAPISPPRPENFEALTAEVILDDIEDRSITARQEFGLARKNSVARSSHEAMLDGSTTVSAIPNLLCNRKLQVPDQQKTTLITSLPQPGH
ncbi:hypothetical protein ACET3X_009631 [Alternaria dauci]|uniref:Uncharacterized protein n=1 Tax=Alternaria dauci TaxID=48095 RepID=A0ABR3U619_9PLEO